MHPVILPTSPYLSKKRLPPFYPHFSVKMLVFYDKSSQGTRHRSIFAKLFVKYCRWLCFTTFSCLAFCTSRLIVNTLFWHFLTFLLLLMVWPFKGGNIFTLPIITSQEPVLRNNLEHTHFRDVVVLNFQISNRLKCVHLLVIELRHPILGFEQTDIEPI